MRPYPAALCLCLVSLLVPVSAHGANLLTNPSFDAVRPLDGWEVRTYGAQPVISPDSAAPHGSRGSLRISAAAPSDTAVAQEVSVTPGRWYRFQAWVRTQDLDPHGASTAGTLQVQSAGGQRILAAAPNHTGNTEWTPASLYFSAPPEGRVRLVLFFVGFGRGAGTAWFGSTSLEEVRLNMMPVTITREPLCPGQISPLQYGQFVEYLCDLIPGMWAEKLYDGSFEGLSPYEVAFRKQTDFREKPWYPTGAVNRAQYTLDPNNPVSGAVSQKIEVDGSLPAQVGLSQDGIAVEKDQACEFSCFFREQGIQSPVQVSLHQDGAVLAHGTFRPNGEWSRCSIRMIPSGTADHATLTIAFRGPGALWMDNASLMPDRNEGGWRPDVVEAIRALKPGVIRFGGSAVEYFDWQDTIGDPDRRKPFRAWGGLQPTGPGLEEIVQLIQRCGAEPLICVRFTGRTPEDAAAEVEYFNGSPDTPMGRLRARNGHPAPYHIRYWQVGNEVSSPEYEAKLAAFCEAMKKVDPTIYLLSSYPTPGVLKNAGLLLDGVSPHQYDCANLIATDAQLQATRKMIAENAPGRPIRVDVTEWNTTAGDFGLGRAKLWTLANALACARYQNLLHRNCDLVQIANRSNLTNSFCSGIIQTDNHRLYKTPTYYAQQLYATIAGDRPLKIDSEVPSDVGPDLSATDSPQGDVTLFAVNDTAEAITRPLDLSAFGEGAREAAVWTLEDHHHAGEPDATNSFDEPERISPTRSQFQPHGARFEYTFPPLSLTVMRWPAR